MFFQCLYCWDLELAVTFYSAAPAEHDSLRLSFARYLVIWLEASSAYGTQQCTIAASSMHPRCRSPHSGYT